MTGPKLPTGPPQLPLEVRFTPRELEYIELRYGQLKGQKEIATLWGVHVNTIKTHSKMVLMKLDTRIGKYDQTTAIIGATKKLILLGYIKLEGEKT
jgi:DNA-binding NarL/FixJ family response regulator